jgi:hypothetical protein
VGCSGGACTFSCVGENYDVDGHPANGCEVPDSPTGNHTQATATLLGQLPCDDTASSFDRLGVIPSDARLHENPLVSGFNNDSGAAPDWVRVLATGGIFCVNDLALTLSMGATAAGCYQLTVLTDKQSPSCVIGAGGSCTILSGPGSYSSQTDIYLKVERICGATGGNLTYTLSGHL